ncbi:MAG: NAD(P)H-hydrate dehydratase [Acidobacteria bacterium]|nr:MAG: NAD(P)H-hydrate dehydratase [Acidobacteriota bacterium]
MKIITAAEMRELDRVTSERFGVPSLTLMENAGTVVADFALAAHPDAKSFGVICGKGNNGGDGFVAARKLHKSGKDVQVLLLGDPKELKGDAAENFRRLAEKSKSSPCRKGRAKGATSSSPSSHPSKVAKGGAPSDFLPHASGAEEDQGTASLDIYERLGSSGSKAVFECDVLIDAILGTGFRPPVSGVYATAITKMNAAAAPVIAVDIPSGADADVFGEQTGAVARADAIVTFTAPRPAHVFGNLTSGPTVIAPIGSPKEAIQSSLKLSLITAKDIAQLFAPRPRNSNKGMYGHVLVIGGSLGKAGAAAMAGFSALRAGAGLVTVATPKSVLATVAGFHPELMTESLEETGDGTISVHALERLEQLAAKKTVLAIGPGISRNKESAEVVQKMVMESEIPIVLDADGLNAFEGNAKAFDRRGREGGAEVAKKGENARADGESNGTQTLVLTPHPGEMSRLIGLSTAAIQRDRVNVARNFAQEHGLILVLKGDRTIVAGPDGEAWVNPTGNPGMATGGTGDILTGIVAGLLVQFPKRAFEAVIAAVYLHGLAGDVAVESMGEQALVAMDLVTAMPEAMRRLREQSREELVTMGA